MEAKVLRNLNGLEFRGVESLRDSIKSVDHCTLCGVLPGDAEPHARAEISNLHKMPSGLANHGTEDRCVKIDNLRPSVFKRLPQGIQSVRQPAPFAQENRVQSHAFVLLWVAEVEVGFTPFLFTGRAFSVWAGLNCGGNSVMTNVLVFFGTRPEASEGPTARYKRLPSRWPGERWFLTSLFWGERMADPILLVAYLNDARPKRSQDCQRREVRADYKPKHTL
jgi:hypothetical protein